MGENESASYNSLSPGTVIAGRYEIAAQLGKASYKVTDASDSKLAVLKFPLLETSEAATVPDKALFSFHNENAIGLKDSRCDDVAGLFYVREFLDGKTLAQVIAEKSSLNQIEFLDTFEQACSALTYMHKKGLAHANLKSSNIIIAENSRVCVVDPLAAEVPRASIRTDIPADIVALGCLMYESLSGKKLSVDGPEPVSFASLVPARNVDEQIEKVIFRCLNKDPKQRYQTADALKADIKRIEEGCEIKNLPPPPSGASGKPAFIIVAIIAVLLVFSAAASHFMSDTQKAARHSSASESMFSELELKTQEGKADEAYKRKDYAAAAQILNLIEPSVSASFGNESRVHARILHKLARSQMLSKECELARDSYNILAELVKKNPAIAPASIRAQLSAEIFNIANAWYNEKDYKNAELGFSAACALEKTFQEDRSAAFFYYLIWVASSQARIDEFEKAEKNFEKAITKFETRFDDPKSLKLALCSYAKVLTEKASSGVGNAEAKKLRKRAKAVLEDAVVLAQEKLSPEDLKEVRAQLRTLQSKM